MSVFDCILLVVAGFIGGFLNTVASSGSAVTLPIMIFLGFSPSVANATNRIPLLIGFIVATYKFHKAGLIQWKKHLKIAPLIVIGTILGTFFVEELSDYYQKILVIFALCVSIIMVFFRYKILKYERPSSQSSKLTIGIILTSFLIGIWGGLIVLDIGIFMLLAFTIQHGLSLSEANVQKSILMIFISSISLLIFSFDFYRTNTVNWLGGLYLSVGSILGSYIGASFSTKPHLKKWIYRILLFTLIGEILKILFEIIKYES